MTGDEWRVLFARLDAENKAAGRCPNCGGSGVVGNLRSSDPHATRRCGRCRGTGAYPKSGKETS